MSDDLDRNPQWHAALALRDAALKASDLLALALDETTTYGQSRELTLAASHFLLRQLIAFGRAAPNTGGWPK